MKYTAIIPARSGSKRLPNKNIKPLGGKPLMIWTLEACVEVAKIDKVILSTDSHDYWNIAQEYIHSEKLALDFRDPEEAGDEVKFFDYIKDKRSKIFGEDTGVFIVALPTVPLRSSGQIEEAIVLHEQKNKPIFSATMYGFPVSFAFTQEINGQWEPAFNESPMLTGNTRSQNQKEYFHPNGAIYVRAIKDLSDSNLSTFYEGAIPYLMLRESSIDIDNKIDFVIAESILNLKNT